MIVYKPLQAIRAISFDLDDTLYNNMPYIHKAERALQDFMAERYPLSQKLTSEDWKNIRVKTLKQNPYLANDIGKLRESVLSQGFTLCGMNKNQIEGAVSDCFNYFYFKRSDFTVDKAIRKVLKQLSSYLPITAITNGNVDCEAIGIGKYFTHILHASPAYPMKPNPAMFNKMSQMLDIPAANILHVGDDLDKDIKGAIDAGYQAAWIAVNRKMQLRNEHAMLLPHIQLHELAELLSLNLQKH